MLINYLVPQVVILHHMLSKAAIKARPSVLWCYKKELGFSRYRYISIFCDIIYYVSEKIYTINYICFTYTLMILDKTQFKMRLVIIF